MDHKQSTFNKDETMNSEVEMITIPLQQYKDLVESYKWLLCLEDAGVDNWGGIEFAQDAFNSMKHEDEDDE